jgi:hypothetical protein
MDQSDSATSGGYSVSGPMKSKVGAGSTPNSIYVPVTISNMAGGSVTYTIPYMAITGRDNLTTVYTYKTPLLGTYNTTNDMGYISTANFVPATAAIDTAGNSSLPVNGASMVVGMRGITPVSESAGYQDSNIKQVAIFMPNGSVKAFTLDKPLRVTYSEDRKMVVVDSYPTFTRRMRAVTGNNTTLTFPAGTPPMSIKSLDGSWGTTTPAAISYEAPRYVQPPS